MARVLELTTRMNAVQRSRGDSATAKAAYRACCEIECEREGRVHDYRRKAGLDIAEIHLPAGSPAWADNRAKLWNAAEGRERNGKRGPNANEWKANAQVARDFLFGFADELSAEGRRQVARTIARHLVKAHGVAVDFAIHAPGGDGDHRNWHCHLMFTTRRMTAAGLGEKSREWDERPKDGSDENSLAKQLRAFVAKTLNDQLQAEGKAHLVHVEHRTYKARGSGKVATQHKGPTKTHILRKQKGMARAAWTKEQREAQRDEQAKALASLKVQQDFALQNKIAELVQRRRQGEAAIRRELEQARAADLAPTGMRRAFLIVTGRAGREAFNRQERETERSMTAAAKLEALKTGLQKEHSDFAAGQVRDREKMIARHQQEDKQLQQAANHRQGIDRAAEVSARHEAALAWARTHERGQQEQGRGMEPSGPTMH